MKKELLKFQDEWEEFLNSLEETTFSSKEEAVVLQNHLSWMQTLLNGKLLKASLLKIEHNGGKNAST